MDLVRGFSLEDLDVPQVQEELDDDQDGGSDWPAARAGIDHIPEILIFTSLQNNLEMFRQ